MEPRPTTASPTDEIDLSLLFFRLRTRWPWFLISLLIAGALAYLYLQVKAPVYDFRSTMLLGNQSSGSKRAQELLEILEVKDNGIKIEDEIGLIKSSGMIRETLHRLPDFMVSYYAVPNNWLNQAKTLQVRELPSGSAPFRVLPDPGAPQLSGTRIKVQVLPDGRYRLQAKAERGTLASLPTGETVREVFDVNLDQTVKAGEQLRHPLLSVTLLAVPGVSAESAERYSFTLKDINSLAGEYGGPLNVRTIDHESRIIELNTKGTVPVKAVQFLDTLMRVYVANDLQEKNQTGQKTVAFLDEELAKLNQARRQSAAALSQYQATRGAVNVGAQASTNIQQLSSLELESSSLASQRSNYESLLNAVRTSRETSSLSAANVNDPVLSSLVIQLAELYKERAGMAVSASDRNPVLTSIDERIKTTKMSLEQNLVSMIRATGMKIASLNGQMTRIRGEISQMPEKERQLAVLKAESDFNDKNYNFLLEKRAEAAIALATNATDKKVIDKATMAGSGPSAPRPMFVGLIALLGGLLLPAGLILLVDKSNQRIRSREDLQRVTNIPMLGLVAHGSKSNQRDMLTNPKGPIAESFRSIRVNLQYLSDGLDKKVLGITSSVPGEGKTFCAVNLATELAHAGKRVLLVETDLRRPTMASYFNQDAGAPGLANYLAGQNTLDECLHPSGLKRLDVLYCGQLPPNPTELLETPRMGALMEQLREEYDYVLLDTPPVGYVSEYFVLLRYIDANIYVVRQNYTDRSLISQIDELYREGKIKHVFIIINDVNFSKTYEYRYKSKSYSYGYS